MHRERVLKIKDCYVDINFSELLMVTELVVRKTIPETYRDGTTCPTSRLFKNNPSYILNIHVMYFNFRIRLFELEGVS